MAGNNEANSNAGTPPDQTLEERGVRLIELVLGYLGFAIVLIYPVAFSCISYNLASVVNYV